MSSITYFKRVSDRYSYTGSPASYSISVEDEYGNQAYTNRINDTFYTDFLNSRFDVTVDSGLMPPGVRAIYPGIVVFERPPRMQMVQYIPMSVEGICEYEDEEDDYPETDMYYIPIPWQVYVASYTISNGQPLLNAVKMFFSKEPLTHPGVKLYLPYIPNFFQNGTLCGPHFEDSDEIYRYPKNISGIVASAYDWVWNTGFNQDLVDGVMTNINANKNNPIVSYVRDNPSHDLVASFYRHLSKFSPEEIITYDWSPPSYTTYYDSSGESNYLYHLTTLQQQYINELDEDLDLDSFYSVSESDFFDWLGNIYSVQKSYSDIMNSVLYDKNNKSERSSNHRISFNNAVNSVPDPRIFLHQLLMYTNTQSA